MARSKFDLTFDFNKVLNDVQPKLNQLLTN